MQQLALGYCQINTFHCRQKEMKNKGNSVKSMMRLLHKLRYAKRHQSGWSNVYLYKKIESIPLAIVELHLSEGVSQSDSQSVENSVK